MNPDPQPYTHTNSEESKDKRQDYQLVKRNLSETRCSSELRQDHYATNNQEMNENQEHQPAESGQYPVVKIEYPVIKRDDLMETVQGEETALENELVRPRRRAVVCADCGRVLSEPPTCADCGRVIPPPPEVCPLCGQDVPVDWMYGSHDTLKNNHRSTEATVCRATTSRKLFNSEGENDSESSASASSDSEDSKNVSEKPFKIADSATFLRRSRWQAFRNYFRWFSAPHKFLKFYKNDSNDENSSESVSERDSYSERN